jgi:hypothetical protein
MVMPQFIKDVKESTGVTHFLQGIIRHRGYGER